MAQLREPKCEEQGKPTVVSSGADPVNPMLRPRGEPGLWSPRTNSPMSSERSESAYRTPSRGNKSRGGGPSRNGGRGPRSTDRMECRRCGELGHFAADCDGPKRSRQKSANTADGTAGRDLVASLKDGIDKQAGNDIAMRELAQEAKEATGLLREAVVHTAALERDLAAYREGSEARVLQDFEKFDVKWGQREVRIRRSALVLGFIASIAGVYYTYGLVILFAWVPLAVLLWLFWPSSGRRMVFDGHYAYQHEDLRPDVIKTKDGVHAPRYGWISYTWPAFIGCKRERLLISYEVLAQLCTPDLMRLDRDVKTVSTAVQSAVGRMPTVKYSKYLPVSGLNVMQNTAAAAVAKFEDMAIQMRKLDFGLPLAATQ